MREWNTWHIEDGYVATFEADDFEGWHLAGGGDDAVGEREREELLDNCVYLARAENRRMTQTLSELAGAIGDWANEWNGRIED